jgi:wyosine [tRNA(Phe)-imidazoG37] synthetase (radical SAM superfamily)
MADATPLPVLGARRPRADGGALWDGIVNGPVVSRRLGTSLGLNLLPARSKICTFDCPYCECGFNTPKAADARWPSPDEVGHALRRALERLAAAAAPPLAWITLAGNGEPTLHPRFAVVVDRVLAARAERAPAARVGILTNGLAAGKPVVAAGLRRLDARMIKLDPGPPERVNGVRYDADLVVAACRALAPVVIQAMVARGADWDGSSDASVAAWLPLLTRAAPAEVHLYSLDRPPADRTLRPVAPERLDRLARTVREALPGANVAVF